MPTKIKFHLKERDDKWKDKHFATNLMKIDRKVSDIWSFVYFEMSVYGGHHFVNVVT